MLLFQNSAIDYREGILIRRGVENVYRATDSTPVDMQSYELCSDMIDLVIDVSNMYG